MTSFITFDFLLIRFNCNCKMPPPVKKIRQIEGQGKLNFLGAVVKGTYAKSYVQCNTVYLSQV